MTLTSFAQDDIWLLSILRLIARFLGNAIATIGAVVVRSQGGAIGSMPWFLEKVFFNRLKSRANDPVVDAGAASGASDGTSCRLRQEPTRLLS